MKEFNGTVVIVDPEKFAKKEDLGKKIDTKLTRISPKLGFRQLFFTETGVGGYYLTAHKVDNAKEYYSIGTENWVKDTINKAFCGILKPKFAQILSESGTVGVFLLEDIENYNPGVIKDIKDCLIIENYKGKIGYLRDKYGVIHFYGTGTTNFYTL